MILVLVFHITLQTMYMVAEIRIRVREALVGQYNYIRTGEPKGTVRTGYVGRIVRSRVRVRDGVLPPP